MYRRQFLSALAAAPLAAQRPSAKPNFIVIYTDDQGIGDLACYGSPEMKTPNLDRMAASGIRFTDWHTNSPVCSPSRASLLTGKYPQNAGIPQILTSKPDFNVSGLRQGEATLPGELKKLGYRTAAVGKWHLGSAAHSTPLAQGFDRHFGFYSGWIDYYSHRYYTLGGTPVFHDLWRDGKEVFEEPVYQTELLTREANAFLDRQRPGADPFFLYLAYGAPHYPMMAPEKYLSRFPASMDRDRREHAAMVAAVDEGVGVILDTLKARGLDNDTVVFFQADNGATREERADHRGRPYRGGSNGSFRGYKGSLWEGGIRVPGLLRWPSRIQPGQVKDGLGVTMDVMPTFLKWAGGTAPAGVDGADMSPWLFDGGAPPHDYVQWQYEGLKAVRRGSWKLMENWRDGLGTPTEQGRRLSNLAEDPREERNWADRNPQLVLELEKLLPKW